MCFKNSVFLAYLTLEPISSPLEQVKYAYRAEII